MKKQNTTNSDAVEKRINELTQYVNHSLLFVEAKHASFIALCLVIVSVIFEHFVEPKSSTCCMKLFILITIITLLASLFESLRAFFPITGIKGKTKDKPSGNIGHIFRCENIERYSTEELMKIITEENEGEEEYVFSNFEKQQIENIIKTSEIVARKYRLIRSAITIFKLFITEFIILITLKLFLI